jgi:hypothetical protein
MPKYYNRWQINPMAWPSDPAAQMKLSMALSDLVKGDLKSGLMKDWGVTTDGTHGYATADCSETEIYAMVLKYNPYIISDIKPVLTVDQHMAIAKAMMAAAAPKKY